MKHSTSHEILTSQNRKPPTMSGNTSSAELFVVGHCTDDVLQHLREHNPLSWGTDQRI